MGKDRHVLLIWEKGSIKLEMKLKGSICPPNHLSLSMEHFQSLGNVPLPQSFGHTLL